MFWILAAAVWVGLGLAAGIVVGRSIKLADDNQAWY